LRHEHIAPRVAGMHHHNGRYTAITDAALVVEWQLADESELMLFLNLSSESVKTPIAPRGALLHCEPAQAAPRLNTGAMPAASAGVYLARPNNAR
jgi:hypothetical protein